MLNKQAKILTEKQQKLVLDFLSDSQHPERNKLIFLLSVKAGLRAKEIAHLTWRMVLDTEGNLTDKISIINSASKGRVGGRVIYLHNSLKMALNAYLETHPDPSPENRIIWMQRSQNPSAQVIVNFFQKLYKDVGYEGASSHSGRRTFITNAARKISSVGGSLRDVQKLSGHASLNTTQRYIEYDSDAMKNVVNLV